MKRIIIALLAVALIAGVSYATIQEQRIQDKVISRIAGVRSSGASCYQYLGDAKNALISLNDNYGTEIDSEDIVKLTNLFNDITSARDILNTLISNIDVNFPSIQ